MRKIKCPKCKSLNVECMGQNRKGFSLGKATIGALFAGRLGALVGFAGAKGKYDFYCKDCGHRFKRK